MKKLRLKTGQIFYKVFDPYGKLNRFIKASNEKNDISEKDWLKGVSCFVLNENGEVLIERRVNKGLTPGKLDLCSGHIDSFETPSQAMLRELQEEIGIDREKAFSNLKPISKHEPAPLRFKSSNKNRNFYIYFFCLKLKNPNIIFQKDEIVDISWIPLEECFELIKSGKTKFPSDYNYEEIFKQVEDIYQGNKKGQINEQNKE